MTILLLLIILILIIINIIACNNTEHFSEKKSLNKTFSQKNTFDLKNKTNKCTGQNNNIINCPKVNGGTTDVFQDDGKTPSLEQLEKDRKRNDQMFNVFQDLTFNDVLVYDNDPYGRLGIDRCLDNKVGYCVPYGNNTGIAWYYPPIYDNLNYGTVIDNEQTPQEQRQPEYGSEIIYPNLR
jgi:hypothetical protein